MQNYDLNQRSIKVNPLQTSIILVNEDNNSRQSERNYQNLNCISNQRTTTAEILDN